MVLDAFSTSGYTSRCVGRWARATNDGMRVGETQGERQFIVDKLVFVRVPVRKPFSASSGYDVLRTYIVCSKIVGGLWTPIYLSLKARTNTWCRAPRSSFSRGHTREAHTFISQ